MSTPDALANVIVQVDGVDSAVNFYGLSISQKIGEVNDFSFKWRQDEGAATLSGYTSFYRSHLSAEISVRINDEFTFKGIITGINCLEQDANGIVYEIIGKGLFARLDGVQECNSFYQKTLQDIFNSLNITSGTTLQLQPAFSGPLFYTAQYNQTTFEFFQMLAKRHGEWLYYDGQQLLLGPPRGAAVAVSDTEIEYLSFRSQVSRTPLNAVGIDRFSGELVQSDNEAPLPGGAGFTDAVMQAGNTAAAAGQFKHFMFWSGATETLLNEQNLAQQQGRAASSVYVSGNTRNSALRLGGKMNITDVAGNSFGEYIIVELHHYSSGIHNYQNFFRAVPAEVAVPPYTDPMATVRCPAQVAVVVENEDPDHQDRVKVRFPWQQATETTPWLKIVTPYAGADHGFRYLPELDDLVYVDFLDNHPDFPFVMGSFFAANRLSGTCYDDYFAKVFGTASGRRMEINDDKNMVRICDNLPDQKPANTMAMCRDGNRTYTTLQSVDGNDNGSVVFVDADRGVHISFLQGDENKLSIVVDRQHNKISIKSAGDISINADGNINMSAGNITLNASRELKLKGGTGGVKMEGMKIKQTADTDIEIEATANLKLGGLNATLQGNVQAEIKGGAMASVTAGIVKIN
jgi:type VI secretion system secreted protein VgrG